MDAVIPWGCAGYPFKYRIENALRQKSAFEGYIYYFFVCGNKQFFGIFHSCGINYVSKVIVWDSRKTVGNIGGGVTDSSRDLLQGKRFFEMVINVQIQSG